MVLCLVLFLFLFLSLLPLEYAVMFFLWKPLSVSRVWNVHGTCLLAVPLLFFLHRHDDVTPSWFRAFESYVLRVLDGNEIKLWSSPSLSVFTVFVDIFSIHTISDWSDFWLLH